MSAREAGDYRVRIRDLPQDERPRERLHHAGPSALASAELLAIVLRTGTAQESALDLAARLLADRGLARLQQASAGELAKEHGLGPAKAAQIKAALELGLRLTTLKPEERVTIHGPDDIAGLLGAEMSLLEQEELRAVLLTTKNQVLAVTTIYRGNINASPVRIAEILREAVRQNCPALIAVHNHPSGDPTPSHDDLAMTRSLVEAGRLLDIEILDHIVLGAGGRHVSLRAAGALEPPAEGAG